MGTRKRSENHPPKDRKPTPPSPLATRPTPTPDVFSDLPTSSGVPKLTLHQLRNPLKDISNHPCLSPFLQPSSNPLALPDPPATPHPTPLPPSTRPAPDPTLVEPAADTPAWVQLPIVLASPLPRPTDTMDLSTRNLKRKLEDEPTWMSKAQRHTHLDAVHAALAKMQFFHPSPGQHQRTEMISEEAEM